MSDVYRYLAKALTHVGKHKEASKFWEQAYSLEPETATAEEHFILGNTLLQMNQVEQAISSCCNAIKTNSNLVGAYQNLGEALKLKSNSLYSNSQNKTYTNNGYLNPQSYSYESAITDKYDLLKRNSHRLVRSDTKLRIKPGVFKDKFKHFEQILNNLISKVAAVFNLNNESSIKYLQSSAELLLLQEKSNSFP